MVEARNIDSDIQDEIRRREAIEDDLNLRLRQQESIAWVGEFAVRTNDLDELFQETVRVVTQTLDMEFCTILELLPDGSELLLRAGVGWAEGSVGHVTVGTDLDSQAGYTLLTDEPVIVTNLRTESRFSGPKLLLDHKVMSGMSVVIPGKGRPFGVLGTYSAKPRNFLSHDTRFINSIANLLGSAIQRFKAEDELRRSRDELFIILNGVSEGITVQDRTGELVYANQAAAEFLGYPTADELTETDTKRVVNKFMLYDENGAPLPVEDLPARLVLQGASKASKRILFKIAETGEERWSITDAAPVYDRSGEVIQAVNIFRDITEMVHTEQHQKLLAAAGELLASSLDYETTLANITKLVVDNLADWCSVHLITESKEVYRISVAHKDPSKIELALELERRYPPEPGTESGVTRVLRTGKPEYYPELPDSFLKATARDSKHLEMMRALQIRSAMIMPLIAHGRTLGAISLIWAESGRKYTRAEVYLVQELANRAALAIENARLYQEAQALNTELEQRVAKRTQQLEISNSHLLKEVAERKTAEQALEKSQVLLNSLFESAPDAFLLVNNDGVIVRVNQQAEKIFGYRREELVGMNVDLLLPGRYHSRHVKNREHFFTNMGTRPMGAGMELQAIRKDRTEFPVDVMLSPVRTEDGELVISAIRDMTEQKHLQTELEETHRRLFESIEAERLLLSQELHDGPIQELYGVALQLEAMKDALATPEGLQELESTAESVQLTIQTLRSVCGELRPPVLSQLGLEKAIRSHLAKIRETHPEFQITAELMNDSGRLAERTRLALYRVYQNAISNVIRHAEAKNINVEFFLDGEHIFLQIQDDGRGFLMPKKRVELVRSGHFGLAGIAERVEALGGQLMIQSAPDQGTTIRVDLPIAAN